MGGAVSELRGEIHTHVLIVQHYPLFLEPYFLHTAELGEGTDRDNPLEEISMDVVISDKRVLEEASTEVELLSEHSAVTEALLHAVRNYRKLELSPDLDTFRQWYDPPWRKNKPFPKFVIVPPDEVPRFRIAILRTSIRCLRLMMFCQEGRKQLEEWDGPAVLNHAAIENPLDDFLDTFAVSTLVTNTLNRFDVGKYLSLYVHVCRFISFVATEERHAKLVGQTGGIEGSIRLLFKAREMQREKKASERAEADRLAKLAKCPESAGWLGYLETKKAPPPPPVDASGQATSLEALASVDFTPTEIGQQALWALDLLAALDYNVSMMKLHRLKYLLEEIRLDPEGNELGGILILTRRLRLIRWDQVGAPSPEKTKHKKHS
ncbi:uncharacterized protein PITG_00696 [Phytophthora infestans T30-4]|uniref:Uncharacterized protein n=1 Tax=Phytophthora infestans (strain T30-4) TaxID=403677 RepID=D0MRG5_PHYIT|nr:uncharacterized protein PITG_00696 [Phytophthora infestans T30-4]EEY58084.1 conserved hypothetical protein [Phytophthora infestans T30-4]|eukprot:XP_002909270.1 conserved hypothetical protein [Phytophthora infestans T30-4]